VQLLKEIKRRNIFPDLLLASKRDESLIEYKTKETNTNEKGKKIRIK
jgi:hypothetical protein